MGEKLEVGGDEVIIGIENTGDYLASGPTGMKLKPIVERVEGNWSLR